MEYHYFISFMYQGRNGIEFGDVGCKRSKPIDTAYELEEIREGLKLEYGDKIVFINIVLLSCTSIKN